MVVLHVKSFLNSIDVISKVFLISPTGKKSKDDQLPSWNSCTISNILTFVGFISYILFHLTYVVNAENDSVVDRVKVVTYVIDVYNKYSGLLMVVILISIGYFQQSRTAKIHRVFCEIENIAMKEMNVELENLSTMRIVYFQIIIMFSAIIITERSNCLMYIGPTKDFVNNCLALCIIPMLVTSTVECRIFAYFLLIKTRYKMINSLIQDYRSNIDKFNRLSTEIKIVEPLWKLVDGNIFYINDFMPPRKFVDKSAPKKVLPNIKIHIAQLLGFVKSLFDFKKSHDYHDNDPGENGINYNFNYIDRIMSMQTISSKLYQIIELISQAYGIQIIAIIAVQFITLTTLMYNFSMNIVRLLSSDISMNDKDAAIDELWSSGLWISIYMYKVYSICYCIHITVDEGQKIGNYLHIFGLNTNMLEEKFKIKMFLLHILHQKIKFAPFGLFEINLRLFSMIFGAIITYILILIQFDIAQKT